MPSQLDWPPPLVAQPSCGCQLHDGVHLHVGVLLASSLAYQLIGCGLVDSLGALGLIYFSINDQKGHKVCLK